MITSMLLLISSLVYAEDDYEFEWEEDREEEAPPPNIEDLINLTQPPKVETAAQNNEIEMINAIQVALSGGTYGPAEIELFQAFILQYPESPVSEYLAEVLLLLNAQNEAYSVQAPAAADSNVDTCFQGEYDARRAVQREVNPGPVLLGFLGGGVGGLAGVTGVSILSAAIEPTAPYPAGDVSDEYASCYKAIYKSQMRGKRAGLAFAGGSIPLVVYGVISLIDYVEY